MDCVWIRQPRGLTLRFRIQLAVMCHRVCSSIMPLSILVGIFQWKFFLKIGLFTMMLILMIMMMIMIIMISIRIGRWCLWLIIIICGRWILFPLHLEVFRHYFMFARKITRHSHIVGIPKYQV